MIDQNDKGAIRRYLLGQFTEAEQEQLELQLLTDQSFVEEFDTTVDEITDQYVSGELPAGERQQVEKYFLKAPERRNYANVVAALNKQSIPKPQKEKSAGWRASWFAWWPQTAGLQAATSA